MTRDKIILKQPKSIGDKDETKLLAKLFSKGAAFDEYLSHIDNPKYLFWAKAMYREPPVDYTPDEAWITARLVRKLKGIKSPIKTAAGEYFTYQRLVRFDKINHRIDQQTSGSFLVTTVSSDDRQKFLSRGIIEEAIASSQLEGASTTRKYAKQMIAENRKPRNVSEQMIFNNYLSMSSIDSDYKDMPLSKKLLLQMHYQLTHDTLEDPADEGRFRVRGDQIDVIYNDKIAYETPDVEFVAVELDRLIDFANNDSEFVHPVIKASLLHFWMGFLHPFADGNGRMARTLFYWYLLKKDYWGMAYVPISMVIKRAKQQYTFAYIHTEQDNLDLTYFLDFSMRKIEMALNEFELYVASLQQENHLIEDRLKGIVVLNERQKQLLYYLVSDINNSASELSHRTMNRIARGTARADLLHLAENELVQSAKEGKQVKYYASEKLLKLVGSPKDAAKVVKRNARKVIRASKKQSAPKPNDLGQSSLF